MASIGLTGLAMAAFAAIAIGAIAFAILFPLFSGERRKDQRLASVMEGRSAKVATRTAKETANYRKKAVADTLKDLDDRKNKETALTLRLRLERAGLQITPRTYWILSVVSGVCAAMIVTMTMKASLLTTVAACIAFFVGLFGIPRWMLNKITTRRQAKFLREMANTMDVIVRGVKSGLPLNECLQIISKESPEPIASEFTEVVEQVRVGVPLGEALDRLSERVPLPEVRFFTIVIGIQQSAGGNLSEALGNLSGVLRDRIRMQMKVKALSSEAKASTIVLGSLPPGVAAMLFVITPGYVTPLFTTTIGHFILAAGAVMMTIGVLIMRKMVNFKY